MINMLTKININTCASDFLEKLFVLLVILYIVFFSAETVLPGIVMDVLNINFFLFLIFINLLLLGLFQDKQNKDSIYSNRSPKKYLVFFVVAFLALMIIISLYRISLLQSFIYLLLVLFVGKLLYSFIEK